MVKIRQVYAARYYTCYAPRAPRFATHDPRKPYQKNAKIAQSKKNGQNKESISSHTHKSQHT